MKALIVIATLSTLAFAAQAESKAEPSAAQIDAAFAKVDADKNGTLTRAEAAKFGIGKKAFDHANPDKDETLDKKEFLAAIVYKFEQANPDKDGTLDPKEAVKAGVKTKKAFLAANPDKDGTLDMAEYLEALSSQVK